MKSAGILLHRRRNGALEVLLAHPGGPFWARRDDGAWTIPKGLVDAGESAAGPHAGHDGPSTSRGPCARSNPAASGSV